MKTGILSGAAIAAALIIAGTASAPGARAEYPERPVTVVVPWGAGGGTDATGRMIAKGLQDQLGVPVNVVNQTGGSGVVGHSAMATADPDGYTVGIATVEIGMLHWLGLTELDHTAYTPIALFNADPAGLSVASDSPYKSPQDVIAAIKADPGKFKTSGSGQGGIWHLALAGWLSQNGIQQADAPYVPVKSAGDAYRDLAAGGVTFVTASIVEGGPMISAGRVRPLAVMAPERLPAFPDVPTLKETTGSDWTMGAWRGVVAPKGLPDDIAARLRKAVRAVYDSAEFKEFMDGRGFGMVWAEGDDYRDFMARSDADLGAVMKTVGLAK
jgi:tripartite-type tricarboxylate transporter receptor subunit TctC